MTTPHQECWPRWSPDKSKISYYLCGASDSYQIYVINSNGTGNTSLGVQGYTPQWSPDGTNLVFNTYAMPTTVEVIPAAGGAPVSLAPGTYPNWSPSGTTIVFCGGATGGSDICTVHPDGTGFINLTNDFATGVANNYPSYSPTGSKILFTANYGSGVTAVFNVMVMNPDGTSPVTLASYVNEGTYNPIWSPDGTKIAYVASGSPYKVYVMSASGSNNILVAANGATGTEVHWSPDSQTVLYDDTTGTINRVQADGTGPATLTSGGTNYTGDWAPRY